jgi:hypothetical protein
MTRSTSPDVMLESAFLVLTMGSGQERPDASNSLSNSICISFIRLMRAAYLQQKTQVTL